MQAQLKQKLKERKEAKYRKILLHELMANGSSSNMHSGKVSIRGDNSTSNLHQSISIAPPDSVNESVEYEDPEQMKR